jgi:CheY-like chemotaxis protein
MTIPVLLAEDNPFNQELVVELLTDTPFALTLAENGAEAVALFKSGQYRVVLMDCQMPVMDGLEATREIRRHEGVTGLDKTPIIAVTANVGATDRARCLGAGMDDYLAKPFELDAFLNLLDRWSGSEAGTPSSESTIDQYVAGSRTSGSPRELQRLRAHLPISTLQRTQFRVEHSRSAHAV